MAAFCSLSLTFLIFAALSLGFKTNGNLRLFTHLTQTAPAGNVNCKCPDQQVYVCTCTRYGMNYYVEAPLAHAIVEGFVPKPADQWTPQDVLLPNDLGTLHKEMHPLMDVQFMPRPFERIKSEFSVVFKEANQIGSSLSIHYNDLKNWNNINLQQLYILIHGFTGNVYEPDISSTRAYLLMRNQYIMTAVITVDWETAAFDFYRQSAANTIVIGREIGMLMFNLVIQKLVDPNLVHLVGYDMGSHVATIAAKFYYELTTAHNTQTGFTEFRDRIGRRTGLNPVAKYFRGFAFASNEDAIFVDIIHTTVAENQGDDSDFLNRRFGLSTLDGEDQHPNHQVDFYPIDSSIGEGCPNALEYGCVFNLAISGFKASLRNGMDRMLFANDEENPTTYMGIDAIPGVNGNHYLSYTVSRDVLASQSLSEAVLPTCSRKLPPKLPPPGDWKDCGISKVSTERAYQGIEGKQYQLPWSVCIMSLKVKYPGELGFFTRRHRDDTDKLDVNSAERLIDPAGFAQSCSGSLIHPQWVVTAAHCFDYHKNGIPIYLIFGSTNCYAPVSVTDHVRRVIIEKQEGSTQNVFFHKTSDPDPRKDISVVNADIALVRLNTPVDVDLDGSVNTICWRGAINYPYGDCADITAAGYGLKGTIADNRLAYINANIAKPESPHHAFVNNPKYGLLSRGVFSKHSDRFFFANFDDIDGRNLCKGDSGGPIIDYSLLNGRATLIGTVSASTLGNCVIEKRAATRKQFDRTYVEDVPDHRIRIISSATGVKVGLFTGWIGEVMEQNKLNAPPSDRFQPTKVKILGEDPDFIDKKVSTPVPPQSGESLLPV